MPAILLDICSYISQLFLFYYYMITLSQIIQNIKLNLKLKLLTFLAATLMTITAVLLKGTFPLNTLALSIIMFILLKFVILMNTKIALLITGLIPLFLALAEIIFVAIFILIVNIPPTEMLHIPWIVFTISIGTSIFLILGIFMFKIFTENKQKIIYYISEFNRKYSKVILFLLALTVLPYIILIPFNIYNYNPIFLLLNIVSIIAISIFLSWYITQIMEKERIQQQLNTLEMDNRTLGSMVDDVRTIKHDFNNIFQAINGYLCTKQYDELDQYVLKIMKECNLLNNLSIISKEVFDNPANYGVIGSKYFIATEQNITMDLDVTVSFKKINFPMAELSRIFGIILDNAIEATSKCENKYIRIEIKYVPKKNATVIRVFNTFDNSQKINLNCLYDKGYSSKEKKSGIGLWEARRTIAKHKQAQIYATIENDKFIQNIIIEN